MLAVKITIDLSGARGVCVDGVRRPVLVVGSSHRIIVAIAGRAECMARVLRTLSYPLRHPVPSLGFTNVLHPATVSTLMDQAVLIQVVQFVGCSSWPSIWGMELLNRERINDKKPFSLSERIDKLMITPVYSST